MESHALAYGLDPRRVPASAAVLPYMEQTFGSWYVRGGMRALADALHDRCAARRVEFHFGAEVVGLAEKEGRAAGLELADGQVVEADLVVAGVSPGRLASIAPTALAEIPVPVLPGRCTVHLALRGARPGGRPTARWSTARTARRSWTRSSAAPAGAPRGVPADGHGAASGRPGHPPGRRARGRHAGRDGRAARPGRLVGRGGRRVRRPDDRRRAGGDPGLAGAAAVARGAHPGGHGGGDRRRGGRVPAPALAGAGGAFLRPGNTTRVPGLYLAGGFAHPGGGLAHAGMSGAMVAGLIVAGADWRGSE
ncbi:FAD-dependent oxidoreductase [Streptomyces stramineus]